MDPKPDKECEKRGDIVLLSEIIQTFVLLQTASYLICTDPKRYLKSTINGLASLPDKDRPYSMQ